MATPDHARPADPAPARPPGSVALVGAGPGDPGLITVRGLELLWGAEVVVYDHLANPALLDSAPPGALRIAAGKSIGHKTLTQEQINATLAEHALLGRRVVRLKGGDPYVFGRGGEEAEHLAGLGIPFEVVPGVTSGLGATAAAGIAVTHRDAASAVAFVTGHADPNNDGRLDWPSLARFPGTLVIYMGVTRLRDLCTTLIAGGKAPDCPAALVEAGTTPRQRTVAGTLATLPDRALAEQVGFPALLVVGEVVARRGRLAWFESLPLLGQRIVVTRPLGNPGDDPARPLAALGAEVLLAPMIEVAPVTDSTALDAAIRRVATYDWLVFTSANGVRHFLDRLLALDLDPRALGTTRLAAIGPSTAEALASYHLRVDLIPAAHTSEGLVAALRERAPGQRILLARASRGRGVLAESLGSTAVLDEVVAYDHRDATRLPDAIAERLAVNSIDWITFTSPATVTRFAALVPDAARAQIGRAIRVATISPLTSHSVRAAGWEVAAEAETASWDAVIAAIQAQVTRRRDYQSES